MLLRRIAAVVLTAAALALLLAPLPWDPTAAVDHGDKWAHALLSAALTVAWRVGGLRRRWLVATGLVFAVGTELAQWALPIHRHADPYDAAADLTGVAVVVVAITIGKLLFPPRDDQALAPDARPAA